MEQHSIKYNFLMDFILKISTLLFPLITFPYVSRILSPEGLGQVSFATGVISYFQMFASLGIPTYAVRLCTKYRDDREQLSRAFQEMFIISMGTTAVSYIAFFIALFTVPQFYGEKNLMLILSLNIFMGSIGFSWLFTAMEQYKYITMRSLVFKCISVVGLFLLVHEQSDYVIYAGITVVSSAGSNIYNFLYSRKFVSWKPVGRYRIAQHWKPIFVLFAMSIAGSVYTNLDTLMLGLLNSTYEVGLYSAAVKLKNLLLSLTVSLGGVMLPRLSYYAQNNKIEEFHTLSAKAFTFIIYSALPLVFYFTVYAKETIVFLSGEAYLPAVITMQVIMPTVLFVSLTNMMGYQVLVPTGREFCVLVSVISGALVDTAINALLIPSLGALGAAIGTVVAELCVLLVQAIYLRKYIGQTWKMISIGNTVVPFAVSGVLAILLKLYLQTTLFWKLSISAIVYFGVYLVVFVLKRDPLICGQLDSVLRKLREKKGL